MVRYRVIAGGLYWVIALRKTCDVRQLLSTVLENVG